MIQVLIQTQVLNHLGDQEGQEDRNLLDNAKINSKFKCSNSRQESLR